MQEITGSTAEEKRLIKAIQKAMGILDNGVIGTDTMTSLAIKVGADAFPVAVTMYGCPTVVAKDLIPFDPNGPIAPYAYSISGSFTWPSGDMPCSILVNRGVVVHSYACHKYRDQPETVLYKLYDGRLGTKRVLTIAELPDGVKWAVGGMGLLKNYDPVVEGFTGDQAGVLRKTGHTVLGYKNGRVYGVCFANHTSEQINKIVKEKFMLEGAIQMDGGSVYGYNLAHMRNRIDWRYGYAIQFIKE